MFRRVIYGVAMMTATFAVKAGVVEDSGVSGGLVVHIGCKDGSKTAAFRLNDNYYVQGLCSKQSQVEAARKKLSSAGNYGYDFTAQLITKDYLPYIDNVVNLIVCDDSSLTSETEINRVLAPNGVAMIKSGDDYKKVVKKRSSAIDDWTHYLHDATGNAVAQDTVVDAPRNMQWWATPRWLRSHHKLASISSVVTADGRLFYIMDEGPSASLKVPGKWSLIARDAFNGRQLWKVDIPTWADINRGFRSGPTQLTRLLVTNGERVYMPLGISAPVTALDAKTGKVIKTYKETDAAEEILYHEGTLVVVSGVGKSEQSTRGIQPSRIITALNAQSGKVLWSRKFKGAAKPFDQTIATDGDIISYQIKGGVVALDFKSGETKWQHGGDQKVAQSNTKDNARGKKGKSKKKSKKSKSIANGFNSTLVINDGVVLSVQSSQLVALDAKQGEQLWSTRTGTGFKSPTDVFVIDGLVWTGPNFSKGLALRTGKAKQTTINIKNLQTAGHHHRCYREKATSRYLMGNYRGIELYDLKGDNHSRNNWVRGLCQYGIMPANGLIYAPSHACGCYMEAKLEGFWALAPKRTKVTTDAPRLEKGPAFGTIKSLPDQKGSWPMLRSNSLRSAVSSSAASLKSTKSWSVDIGNHVTPPVISGNTVIVADVERHRIVALDATTGKQRWDYTTGARVDSPPTISGNAVVCGSADGYVYCLSLDKGELAWRFRGAPTDLKTFSADQLESVWPIHGSIMIENGTAYFAAGRSSYIDGGIYTYALDVATGDVKAENHLSSEHAGASAAGKVKRIEQNAMDDKTLNAPDQADAFSMKGFKTDIFVSDGTNVFMRQLMFDRNLVSKEGKSRHLFSTSTLLDDNENHRSHWMLGTGDFSQTGVAYSWIANTNRAPNVTLKAKGIMISFDDKFAWAVDRSASRMNECYRVVGYENKPFDSTETATPDFANKETKEMLKPVAKLWEQKYSMRPRSIAKSGNNLIIGGIPNFDKGKDLFAAIEGEKGGAIYFLSTEDGSKVGEIALDKSPVWDGVAIAYGQIFVTTIDGKVTCLK